MKYTISELITILKATPLQLSATFTEIEHLQLDSRQVLFPAASLFFAIRGTRHNAHDFIPELYNRGVRSFIVSENIDYQNFTDANFLLVSDALTALQHLAAHHRNRFDLPVIGITGSNGKTIIKEWLFQLLREDYQIVRSPRSYNSQVGVPLSVWQIQAEHNLGIFEAGISQMDEMERLAPIVACTWGLFTNIGEAHNAGFESMAIKTQQKARLFARADLVFYCKDHSLVDEAVRALARPTFTWSHTREADLEIRRVHSHDAQATLIEGIFQGVMYHIRIPFTDAASVENAIHCWAILLHLGIPANVIQQRMALLEPVEMRLQLKEGINNCIVINDSYNSDLTSLTIALNFVEQQRRKPRRTLILSDILQSGQDARALYTAVARLIQEKKMNRLIAIGETIAILPSLLPADIEVLYFKSTDAFLGQLNDLVFHQETILLKGARQFAFERIADRLSLRAHKTVLEINLQNLLRNLYLYSRYIQPGVRTMAMVKAAAYGSGGAEVARLLEFHGVHYLTVAYTDEGIELRKEGIHIPIMVLNPEESSFDAMHRYRLEPEIYSLSLLRAYATYSSTADEGLPFPIHLKMNTGMNRLGMTALDLPELLQLLRDYSQLEVRSIFTHLAASEAPEHDAFTLQQLHDFVEMYEQIAAALGYRPIRHALNTAGVHRFPDWQLDMVRLGIGLYGLDNYTEFREKLFPVLTLKATISQIHTLHPGESVGYGRRWRAARTSRIGTISIGYADGLRRAAGNGRFAVWLHGQRAPIVGTVAMDMCMIDLTDLPEAREGDEVEIFGENLSVTVLANVYDTIPLEVFTTISARVKRVYLQE